MKKLLALLLLPVLAFAAAGDIKMDRKNSSDNAWISTIFAKVNSSIIGLDSSGVPTTVTGLTWTSGSHLLLGGLAVDGTGVLQFPTATTSAGGITFGTDTNFYRNAAGQASLNATSGDVAFILAKAGTTSGYLSTSGSAVQLASQSGQLLLLSNNVTAVTLDGSQNATLAGRLFAADGAAGTPSMSFTNANTTGFFRAASPGIGVSVGTVEIARFFATNLVGMPGSSFGASIKFDANTTQQGFYFNGETSGLGRTGVNATALYNANVATLSMDASNNAIFAHKVTINSTGGTTNADALFFGTDTALFRVAASSLQSTNNLSLTVPGTFTINANSTGQIIFQTGTNTTALTLDTSQNAVLVGNLNINTIGKTLTVKSGSNAKAGTFTLVAGSATVANTSVTANSVVNFTLKTVGGTIGTQAPFITAISVGTSFTVTALGTNTSTYNYVIEEVN